MFSDSDTDADGIHDFTINEHFAKAFEYKKEREELAKLKEKYGSDYSSSGASDVDHSEGSEDTEEDSDGEGLTPAVDAAILRTLALIKKKDPTIYEGGRQVFEEEHTRTQDKAPKMRPKTKEKSKPLTIKDVSLTSALAEVLPHSRSQSVEPPPLGYTEEQVLLRSETRAAFHGAIDSEEGEDDLLVPRSRARDELQLEEEEYKAFLEREVGEDIHHIVTVDTEQVIGPPVDVQFTEASDREQTKKKGDKGPKGGKERGRGQSEAGEKKNTKQRDQESKEETDQEFLLNYIFNRGWMDLSKRRVPTYSEIIGSSKRRPASLQDSDSNDGADKISGDEQVATLSDENSFDDLADAFESSYNFRFEEPGGALIASFPRNVPSARREPTIRKDARVRKKERKESEKRALLEARREEIRKERGLVHAMVAKEHHDAFAIENDTSDKNISKKQQRKQERARLKALKSKELRRKLEMVSFEGGLGGFDNESFAHLDLDADWDPLKHDLQMAELYGGDGGIVDDNDTEKPTWDDDINIDDIDPSARVKPRAELKKQKKKQKKKKEKAIDDVGVDEDEMDAEAIRDDWDEDEGEWRGTEEERRRKADAYMDEVINKLGFSGITSHMPTRFHYIPTAPENYSLTPAEILLATDAELNSYVGLKKLAPYRVNKGGRVKKIWDPKRTQRLKDFREQLHSRVRSNYEGAWSLEGGTNTKSKIAEVQGENKKRKGKKERAKLRAMQDDNNREEDRDAAGESEKRKCDLNVGSHPVSHPGEAEIKDARKRKRRRRHKNDSDGVDEMGTATMS